MATGLSVIIPTYNEAHNIEEVLQSVSFAAEIIVVDSNSTDNTTALAKKYTKTIFTRAFDGYAANKNWAIEKANHEWILIIDADERVSVELQAEIIEAIQTNAGYDSFWISRENYFMGKKMRFSGMQNDKVIRLFKKGQAKYSIKHVHEQMETIGEVGFLKNKLLHNTYQNLPKFLKKTFKYANLSALDYEVKTKKITFFHLLIKPTWRFIKHYCIQQGFRDGRRGLIYSMIVSFGVFLRYLTIWMNRNKIV